ncbi:MAG: aspartate kinase [Saprospiraceae bacterium]|nr:aspartate kinase [Saprospiraceae bacterium]
MNVFKFGGASVKNAAGIINVSKIIQKFKSGPLVVVVSATGKTTNALEEVINEKFTDKKKSIQLLRVIQNKHIEIAKDLFDTIPEELLSQIQEHIVEGEWIIEEEREMQYDYVYDQIICIGELISSRILTHYLNSQNISTEFVDARSMIETDDTWREGRIQWSNTNEKINSHCNPILNAGKIVLTQGFIGSTSENNTVSLGREGSDYTAAIISAAMDAKSMIIWKDVPGVLTGDPKVFENVTKLDHLTFMEAIEMTYYGAKVIHPKTIQPLKNKNIPLHVRSFLDPESDGTLIFGEIEREYPPIVVLESNQALVHFSSKDLSFIAEDHLARLFDLFDKLRIKVNVMRNTAISFTVCIQNDKSKIHLLTETVHEQFAVIVEPNLDLYTIRHCNDSMLPKLLEEKIIIMEERIRKTVQVVVKSAPGIIHKRVEA